MAQLVPKDNRAQRVLRAQRVPRAQQVITDKWEQQEDKVQLVRKV
jgi:hypothetical protein